MKKILIMLLLIANNYNSKAQTVDSLRLKLDDIFLYVDKSQIPSGYLAEYGAEFSPLHFFNGVITDSNLVAGLDNFRFIYSDIQTGKINPTVPSLLPLENINVLIDSANAQGKNALVLLAGNYASLKPTAITDGLLTWKRERLNDVAGRASSPYLNNVIFAVAPIIASFTDTVNISYDPNLIFTNNNTTLQNIFIDFEDGGGFLPLTAAGLSHAYTDSTGVKEIIVKGETSTGQFLYCKTLVHVIVEANTANRYIDTDPYGREILIRNLPNAAQYLDYQDRLQIRYAQNNPTRTLAVTQRRLRKPIIYVEGYDISGKNGLDFPFPTFTHGKLGYNLLDLISTSTDIEERGEWVSLSKPPKNYDFMNDLDNNGGYDLVFVNYNTLRSIEENANMLRRVLEWVNADKAVIGSIEKNVVIGVSMGGLVARYCLANMTKNVGFNSADTKLLITHDSPHQGSNVPLGLQYFLYDLGYTKILGNRIKDTKADIKDFMDLNENVESTKQLL